jgi:hypothetical protein
MEDKFNAKATDSLKQWVADLVCPVCFAALRFSDSDVTCTGCGRIYPIVDGIPVLIPEQSTPPAK